MQDKLYDLTNPQKSIWYTEEVLKGTTVNNICTSGIIYENIDEDLLKKAINNVVRQHDSFRIRIVLQEGQVKQYISEFKNFEIETEYISKQSELKKIEEEQANYKFDILDSDLFKFKLVILKGKFACVVLTVNHIISDSWSMGITIQEILRNYHELQDANCLNNANNTNNTNIKKHNNNTSISNNNITSYIDYISSEIDYKNSQKYEKDKAYWSEVFKTIPEQATIPASLAMSQSNKANRYNFDIDKNIVSKIHDFCSKNNFSVFNFFMAIFSIYIGRVSNTDDFVIGTPILNRTNFKEKHATGMFVNTVPVRVNSFNHSLFKDFVNSFAQKLREILRHQKYSYTSILEDLRANNKNVPNLYNIMISYQVTKAFDESLGNYVTNWTFNNYIANDIDIHIFDINNTGKLLVSYDYLTSKYELKDIQDLHARIVNMINQVLANENILTNDIEIITDKEKNQILNEFNDTTVEYPKDKTIVDLFEEQVQKTPGNTAVVFGEQQLTYKELNEKVNSLAYLLREKENIGRNDLIGIMVNRSIEMIISILAVLKAGGCYIPIDPSYPKDRIDYMLNSSNSKLLLTQEELENKIDFKNKLCVDLSNETIYSMPNKNLKTINKPDDLAYVIFTSGSTGKPKGVMLMHKALSNLTNYCNNYIEYLKNETYKTIVSITTVSFDIFIFESLISLQKGLKLVIANENEQTSPELLNSLIEKHNAQIIQSTPSRMKIFVDNINTMPSLKNLKYITLAGEQLPLDLVNQLHNLSNVTIYNGYGPSETTVFSTLTKMENNYITIGKPLYNTKIYILDKNLKPVPIGTTGEIYIAGEGVGKGYLGNKELSLKSFIPNPFIPDTIMYKTGDLGKYNKNGEIICLGRADNQVKIRGLRIELEEIENKIAELPDIKTCLVVKNTDTESHETLCAYYTAKSTIKTNDIRAHLSKYLPNYMVPQYFMQIDSFNYTPNGKIDRKKLPAPKYNNNEKELIKPRNDIDSKLLVLFKKLFNINKLSIDDSFFELGGDSLLAINLCIQIHSSFKVELFVKDILEHPTIKELSNIISKKLNTSNEQTIKPIEKADSYPVSSSQKMIYFASEVAGNSSTLYNIPGGIILEGIIDKNKLEKCFYKLIDRHESLRTYFEVQDEKVVQKIIEHIEFKLDVVNDEDFKDLYILFKEFVRKFDLSKAPLFRAKLIIFPNNKSALFFDMHHIISDGTSISILADELCKLYNGEDLPELKITYKDFTAFENKRLESDNLKEASDYWVHQFSDEIPVLNLPTNYPRPAVQSFEGKKVYSVINKQTTKKIYNIANNLGITPYMLLLSCYYILLSKYTAQNDIVIGSPIVGRDMSVLNNLIGMFVNTLALKNNVDRNLSFRDFVLRIKENVLEAYKYQTYPFDELVTKLNIKRDISRNPLFDTMFTYQNNRYKDLNFKNIKAKYYIPDTNISKFDLSLEAVPVNNEIKLSFEYALKLFTEDFIQNLSEHYLNILNVVLGNVDIKISEIDMLSTQEKNKILYEFNDTNKPYPKDKTVIDLFEEQVQKTPNAIAIECQNKEITYLEFNKKVNQLARYLRNKGIKRGDFVCIVASRSIEMMIGIFGIIKSGAAYVPVDPNYPEDRINHILEDSSPKVVLLANAYVETNIPKIDLSKKEYEIEKDTNLEIVNKPEDPIYCIYTSGTTGKPKGVVNKHIGLINRILWMNDEYPIKQGDIILQKTTYCFDVSVWELIWWSFVGAKVSMLNVGGEKEPKEILDAIEKNKITTIHFVPSMLNMMLVYIENMNGLENKLKTLKYVFTSGEELKKKQVELFNKKIKSVNENVKLINVYGPTEASIDVTCYECKDENPLIPIGKPISNIQIYILDGMNLCGIGVPGEICIGGVGVAKGYLNRDELNKEKFIENPFAEGKMYRTGDLGRWQSDGNIEYIGRIDHQVKIRGLRIELDEIENFMLKYPHIKNVVVIKQTIQNRDFISSYYVSDKRININELRKYLSKYLPIYMVPSYFIALDNLPYSPNGKLDRKSLPLPTDILNISEEKYVAPTTNLQKQLVSIWEKVLNTRPIGINDNFFELGGDSLLAMNLNVELLKISNKINYSDIFRFPTIAEQEEKINSLEDKPFFSKIENLSDSFTDILKNATKNSKIKRWHPEGILLTGSTGFLGIHVLEQFIKRENTNIYCIIRDEPSITSKTKLYQKLNYYLGDKYNDLIDKRIFALTGDITKPGFGLNQEDILKIANSVDVVINCAANVSHFGKYNDFYNTNVKSVKYIIDFCNSFNLKLYHISTMSVSGTKLDTSYPAYQKQGIIKFDESCLYVGQTLDNVYVHSKFEAETHVLNAISNGLDGYILRIGNLMPRMRDGVFQENLSSNAFINRITSFLRIGYIPDYILDEPLELTPIDYAAKAIYKLIVHPNSVNRIFHIYNPNYIETRKLFYKAKKLKFNLDVLSEEKFKIKIKEILNKEDSKNLLEFLLNDFNKDLHLDYKYDIIAKSSFTIKYLKRTFFKWPKLSNKYLIKFIKLLKKVI